MIVQQTSEATWTVQGRGMLITVQHHPDAPEYRRWTVHTDNASARAWGNGRSLAYKQFEALEQVESAYKSLRGLSTIVSPSNCIPFRKVA